MIELFRMTNILDYLAAEQLTKFSMTLSYKLRTEVAHWLLLLYSELRDMEKCYNEND